MYGLPQDASLSVLCVEILPTITNIFQHINGFGDKLTHNVTLGTTGLSKENYEYTTGTQNTNAEAMYVEQPKPLSDQLGDYRILRTSPLTEVPDVCCTDC